MTAAIIVIESGLIYSACLGCLLGMYLGNTFAQYVLIDTVSGSMICQYRILSDSKPQSAGYPACGMSRPEPSPWYYANSVEQGIVFSLIIVRVGLGLTSDAVGNARYRMPSLPSSGQRSSQRRRMGVDVNSMDPLQVQTTKITQDDGITPMSLDEDTLEMSRTAGEKHLSLSSTHAVS